MKKREIANSKNLLVYIGKFERASKVLSINLKRIVIALIFLTFILPINKQVLADKKIKPGKKQATLILSDGRKIILNMSSDTIVNSKTSNVRIKIDSVGINYITTDSIKQLNQAKSKTIEKKEVKQK